MTDSESTNCASYSCYPAVLSAHGHPPGYDPKRPCTLLTAEKALKKKEGLYKPFGPTDERVASFEHSASEDVPTDTNGLCAALLVSPETKLAEYPLWSRKSQSEH